MAKLNSFQDLLNAARGVPFGIEFSGHNIFEQFSSSYQIEDHIMAENLHQKLKGVLNNHFGASDKK